MGEAAKQLDRSSKRQLRMTRQRRVILDELEKHTHLTADEVYEAVRKRLPNISMSTVYHNLEILCEQGKIRQLEVGCFKRHFDFDTRDHYHVRCARCGRVENLPVQPFTYIEQAFRDLCDYKVTGHRLELLGLCPECLKQKEEEQRRDAAREPVVATAKKS